MRRALVSPDDGHRLWSETYDSDANPLLSLEMRVVLDCLPDLRGRVFVDAACGTGRWLATARLRGARVWGIDRCVEMLAVAGSKIGLRGRIALGDLRRLPLADDCADLAMCALSLGYVDSIETAVMELSRCVRRGGSVWVTDVHPKGLEAGWKRSFRSGDRVVEMENYPYSVERLLEAGRQAGLEAATVIEERFGAAEREIFRGAGKLSLFDKACQHPAVLIARWNRPKSRKTPFRDTREARELLTN